MNAGLLLKNAVNNFKTRYVMTADEIMKLIDKHKIVILVEKYQNRHLIAGYNKMKEFFIKMDAPWGRSFTDWELIRYIDHLGDCSEEKYSFDDAEYWAVEAKPLTKLQKVYLRYIKGISK